MVDNVEHVGAANVDDMLYPCQKCQRRFRTLRRLHQTLQNTATSCTRDEPLDIQAKLEDSTEVKRKEVK